MSNSRKTKHETILSTLREAIVSGQYTEGERLPPEGELVEQFGASRPTIARAMRELQAAGLVERKVGSGTYVRRPAGGSRRLFGLLIPGLGETEIFEPICGQIAKEARRNNDGLLWGHFSRAGDGDNRHQQIRETFRHYVQENISGLFVSLDHPPDEDALSRTILSAAEDARIPMVLLDRDVARYPERSRHDLVGIDNRRAGHRVTAHLIGLGCKRVDFLINSHPGPNADIRVAGYRDALLAAGIAPRDEWVHGGRPEDPEFAAELVRKRGADAIVCVNDATAARLMRSLDGLSIRVPRDVRIVSFDDTRLAEMLTVPLTTLHQPCQAIGTAAYRMMMTRLEHPELPVMDLLLDAPLIVRASCGAGFPAHAATSAA